MERKLEEIQLSPLNFNAFHRVLDVFGCLLAVYLSMQFFDGPAPGIAVFILFNFFTAFFRLNLRGRDKLLRASTRIVMLGMFFIVLGLNIVLGVFFQEYLGWQGAFLVLFVAVMTAHNVSTDALSCRLKGDWNARFLPLAFLHAMFLLLFVLLTVYVLPNDFWLPIVAEILLTFAMLGAQTRRPAPIRTLPPEKLQQVGSFNLYRNMALYASMAVYLSFLIYVVFAFIAPQGGDVPTFWISTLWLTVVLAVTFTVYRLLSGRKGLGLGLFIAGAVVWAGAAYLLFRNFASPARNWWSLLWAAGSGCMFAVTSDFQRRFKLVSPLIDFEISDDALMQNTVEIQNLSFMISETLVLTMLVTWGFISDGLGAYETLTGSAMTLLPMVFAVVAIIMAARQPMEDSFDGRLEKAGRGEATPELREKLDRTFVKQYKKKYGVRIIMSLLRPILHHKVYGKNNVDENTPAIFVCNHGEIYGPMVSVVYLPFHFRPWIEERMIDREQVSDFMYAGTFEPIRHMPQWLKRCLNFFASKFCLWALNSFDPIPVRRGSIRAAVQTMNESVEAMKADDNILLFPENPDANPGGRYGASALSTKFFTGFAHLAIQYYNETGKIATFYPIFADKKKRTYTIGEGIPFEPGQANSEEKRRIAAALHDAMEKMRTGD